MQLYSVLALGSVGLNWIVSVSAVRVWCVVLLALLYFSLLLCFVMAGMPLRLSLVNTGEYSCVYCAS